MHHQSALTKVAVIVGVPPLERDARGVLRARCRALRGRVCAGEDGAVIVPNASGVLYERVARRRRDLVRRHICARKGDTVREIR